MTTITASKARANLYRLVDNVGQSHEPIQIMGKRRTAILLDQEDWRAIEETLYLLSIPKMRDSIMKGMRTPIKKCVKELEW